MGPASVGQSDVPVGNVSWPCQIPKRCRCLIFCPKWSTALTVQPVSFSRRVSKNDYCRYVHGNSVPHQETQHQENMTCNGWCLCLSIFLPWHFFGIWMPLYWKQDPGFLWQVRKTHAWPLCLRGIARIHTFYDLKCQQLKQYYDEERVDSGGKTITEDGWYTWCAFENWLVRSAIALPTLLSLAYFSINGI